MRRKSAPAALPKKRLPPIFVVQIVELAQGGEVLACPLGWEKAGKPPVLSLIAPEGGAGPLTIGQRALVRRLAFQNGRLQAQIVRLLEQPADRVVGLFQKQGVGGRIRSADRRDREEYLVGPEDLSTAQSGDIVIAEKLFSKHRPQRARIVETLGRHDSPQAISALTIACHDLPHIFSSQALAEAECARPVALEGRVDLRDLPLVTIDGSDARDFDDAVFAEPDTDPENRQGWRLLVAIADVAHYVTPGSALDREAFERGNSVYFPDRVVPMLPEALSNELCSLKPGQERACLAVHIRIDAKGRKLDHRFVRGVMRSAARLTYEQAQALQDSSQEEPQAQEGPTPPYPHISSLFGAYRALQIARCKRGTLDLDLPERSIALDRDGTVSEIVARLRLDSHRLIEEFMILANVCAAETLEATGQLCMYRVHDEPSNEKLAGLRDFVQGLGLSFSAGQRIEPRHFMRLLTEARGSPHESLIDEMVLRAQAQARYSPENIGHFGLALHRYAHFTSPIRRYADVTVHRALIAGAGLAADGAALLPTRERFSEIADRISAAERTAAQAERDALDRYSAAFLSAHRDAVFTGRISGVTNFGLFVRLDNSGADGLIPMRALPKDYYRHEEGFHRLVGERKGLVFTLGQLVEVRLSDIDILTGSLLLTLHRVAPRLAKAPKKRAKKRG